MFTLIFSNGDYLELRARTREQAEIEMHTRFTDEEIRALEIEIVDSEQTEEA